MRLRSCLAAALTAATLAIGGCSGDDGQDDGASAPAPFAPDRTTWEATFRSDATVLDVDLVSSTLRNPDATDGVYRFDASAGDVVAKLPPGRAVLLSGVDIVRVKSVTIDGPEILVATEPASLPDVVQDGKATWDIGIQRAGIAPGGANTC